MKIQKPIRVIQTDLKQFGMVKTIYDLAFRSSNLLVYFKILRCMALDRVDPDFLKPSDRYKCKFLNEDEIFELATNRESDLSRDFLLKALEKGDQCFGIVDGDKLASYGWYSNEPTNISDDLRIHFDKQCVYMYRGFTQPSYRGQHLHAIGMTMALDHYLNRGFRGLVSYVEENNFASLKSVYRMGFRDFGKVYILGGFSRYLVHCSPGCKDYGVSVMRHDVAT